MKLYSICLIAILALNSTASEAKTVNTSNYLTTDEDREVKNFHAVSSSGSFNVTVKMGSKESISLEGDQQDLDRVETLVQNGVLKIRLKRDVNTWNEGVGNISIIVTAKKLDGLILSGSGSIDLEGKLNSAGADIQLSGSGKITAGLDTQTVGIALSGSGNVSLSGEVGSANISISGSGDVNAKNLISDKSQVQIAGSGNVYLNAKEELNATVLGSGSVRYKGNPKLSVSKVGSGSVEKM
ncbi:hypothetical protein A5893_03805 [Pedobacter psychrophilus]|uniref:Putative auto-transporter adhesin head GIN domain-containing protein n=1 Tax=Pedobacter psychrophilus TaxID=1826909 RepID=A0A179DMF8_9SPHI|nr:head GIN domain-containing protein [Pedobacter psychrophilus]OAQ42247.1 hypothetical protein A5893_03805 [Pedobacter psychrophilus]